MKKFTSVVAVFVATAMIATSAFASGGATTGSPATGADKSKAEQPKADQPSASPATAPAPTSAGGDYLARHTMEGEVTKVDEKKGRLTLKTPEGNMDLHFPPSALANVKKGDRIAVELAMKPMGSAGAKSDKEKGAASPKTDKEKK
jgi:hypothetical protein